MQLGAKQVKQVHNWKKALLQCPRNEHIGNVLPVVHADEPRQRELVHRVDVGQLGDGEEEDGGMNCDWSVAVSSLKKIRSLYLGQNVSLMEKLQ